MFELGDRYRTVVLTGVPALSTATEDGRRRFANLIDVCWDRDVPLIILNKLNASATLDAPLADQQRVTSRISLLRPA